MAERMVRFILVGLCGVMLPLPLRELGDSHFSLQSHFEVSSAVDCVELFHAASHGDWPRRLVVAVPTAQASDDPACPGKAFARMGILLPVGLALERRDERLDGL